MDVILILTLAAIAVVLLFDFSNGFHDAANIIATVIASRAMTPVQAVLTVSVFEFLGPLLGGTAVANTIGNFVHLDDLPPTAALQIILCGLTGAIAWNFLTWWRGIPSSSSHALVGGMAGAVVVAINSLYTAPEIIHQANDAGIEIMFVMSNFYKTMKAAQKKTKIKTLIVTNIKETLPPVLKILFTLVKEKKGGFRVELAEGDIWLQDLLAKHKPEDRPKLDIRADDIALFQYSGGTTGI